MENQTETTPLQAVTEELPIETDPGPVPGEVETTEAGEPVSGVTEPASDSEALTGSEE